MTQRVIAGTTCFHAVDEPFTAALSDPEVLEAARACRKAELRSSDTTWEQRHRVDTLLADRGVDRGRGWLWYYTARFVDVFEIGMAVPLCGMVLPGAPLTVGQAQALGLRWSQECAKKVGLVDDDRHPLSRVDATGARRAYMHAIECATCWHAGVGACEMFALLAKREIESEVDPRLEELIA